MSLHTDVGSTDYSSVAWSAVDWALDVRSHVSSPIIHNTKLEPAHTSPLKQPLRIIFPTHSPQKPPILLAITFKRPLPLRAIVQIPIPMASPLSRCHGINLLNNAPCRRLNELVIPAFVPVNRKADDDERLPCAVVVQTQRVRIPFACPVRQERLQKERPDQSFHIDPSQGGDGVAVGGMRRDEGSVVVLDGRVGEDLALAWRVERVHLVGRAGEGSELAGAPEAPERSEGGGLPVRGPFLFVLGGFGVDEIHGYGLEAEVLDIGEAGYGAGGMVIVRATGILRIHSIDGFMESCEDLDGLKGGHIEEAAPYHSGGEAAGREARDDAEVVGAAFEGTPEVGIGRFGGRRDEAGGKNELVAENVGAD